MKVLSKITLAILAVAFLFSCGSEAEGEAAKTEEASQPAAEKTASATEYQVNEGKVYWAAGKQVGNSVHTGTFAIQKGTLGISNGAISSGQFGIDMNSLNVTDLSGEQKSDLEGHLKSPDFFDVAKNPTGMFQVIAVEPLSGNAEANHTIKGNLTLNGVTKSVTFPANVIITDQMISAITPKFTINRTDWNIKYGSGNFFKELTADKIINDEVSLNLEIKAQRADH